MERAFVAGATHKVEISIGRRARIQALKPFDEPRFPENQSRLPLLVRFVADGAVQEDTLLLDRDLARDSPPARFTLTVPSDAGTVAALVAVYRADAKGQLLQAGVLRGEVQPDMTSAQSASTRIELVVEAILADFLNTLPSRAAGSVVTVGAGFVVAGPDAAVRVDRSMLADEVAAIADRIRVAADRLTIDDADFEPLLCDLAAHGARFRSRLTDSVSAVVQLCVAFAGGGARPQRRPSAGVRLRRSSTHS